MSFTKVVTSLSVGTLVHVVGVSPKIMAAKSGKAAFFAPEMVTSPWIFAPPVIKNLSMIIALPVVAIRRA